MVAALKRLSIGNMMSYDPDLPLEDMEYLYQFQQNQQQEEALSSSHSNASESSGTGSVNRKSTVSRKSSLSRTLSLSRHASQSKKGGLPVSSSRESLETNEEFYDAEENDQPLDTNELLWVPANLHPEVDPEQFKMHIKLQVEEIMERKLSRRRSVSRRSSLSSSALPSEDLENLREIETPTGSSDSDGQPTTPKEDRISADQLLVYLQKRYSNPSLRDLTNELETLSKIAGMDANDAVTLARTLSTNSLGYTDVEKLAIDELTSPPHSTSTTSPRNADPEELSQYEPESPTSHKTPRMNPDASLPYSAHLPDHLSSGPPDSFHPKHESQHASLPGMSSKEFALKRSRRLDYRKPHSSSTTSLGSQLQNNKADKLAELRSNLSGSRSSSSLLIPPVHDSSKPKFKTRSKNQPPNPRSSQMLFSYRNVNNSNKPAVAPRNGDSPYPGAIASHVPLEQNFSSSKYNHQSLSRRLSKANSQPPLGGDKLHRRTSGSRTPSGGSQNSVERDPSHRASRQPAPYQTYSSGLGQGLGEPGHGGAYHEGAHYGTSNSHTLKHHYRSHQRHHQHSYQQRTPQYTRSQSLSSHYGAQPYPVHQSLSQVPIRTDQQHHAAMNSSVTVILPKESTFQQLNLPLPQQTLHQPYVTTPTPSSSSPSSSGSLKQDRSKQLNQNLDMLRSEINDFKEKLTRTDSVGSFPRVNSGLSLPEPESTNSSDTTESDFSFDATYQDISYEDSLGIEKEVLLELRDLRSRELQDGSKASESLSSASTESSTLHEDHERQSHGLKVSPDYQDSLFDDPLESEEHEEASTQGSVLLPNHSSTSLVSDESKSTITETGPAKKVLNKKKSWPWAKERSVSASSVEGDLSAVEESEVNTVPTRSVSTPTPEVKSPTESTFSTQENILQEVPAAQQLSIRKSSSKQPASKEGSGKENMISKLFRKKKSASGLESSLHGARKTVTDSTLENESDLEPRTGHSGGKKMSGGIFKKKNRTSSEKERHKEATLVKQKSLNSLNSGDSSEMSEEGKRRSSDSKVSRSRKTRTSNASSDREMEKTNSKESRRTASKESNMDVDEAENADEANDDGSHPLKTTLDVQEKLKKSIRRTSRANQPIQFTDSAFGFPLPPPSQSTLVMLDYRFPVHVERAIYRLSHLKLANPKRSLREQVLLSNFMYAYLNLVDHTLHLEQQMNNDSEGEKEHKEVAFAGDEVMDDDKEEGRDELEANIGDTITIDLDIADESHLRA